MAQHSKNSPASPAASSPLLHINTARLYRDGIGAEGIDKAEIKALALELQRVHQVVVNKSTGGLNAEFACLNLHDSMPELLPPIEAAAEQLQRFEDIAVIGIGGSSLGAKAVYQSLGADELVPRRSRLHFLENIDPRHLDSFIQNRSAEKTAVICISKSGGTIETVIQYLIVREWLEQQLGKDKARQHQWLITDPAQGWLREAARHDGITALPVPPRVGGRYSVLTAVGLLPLAAAGVDIRGLLAGSAANAARCAAENPVTNPALEMAALFYLLDTRRNKRVSIVMPYADSLQLFGDWYRQLWAESLGKRRGGRQDDAPAGTLPVTALGTVDQHSQLQMYLESRRDKIFTFMTIDHWRQNPSIPLSDTDRKFFPYLEGKRLQDVLDAEFRATSQVITETGHPNMTLSLPALDAHALGQLIDLYQRATVYAGLLYGINPLDQPAVEKGKKLAIQFLSGGHQP
ncbi:MAG: glucose-6-phosphate isomerase [Sulfuricaulis sp.]